MISTSLNDVRARDGLRNEMAEQADRWLRERGLSEPPQAPGFSGIAPVEPLAMRQRITADTQQQKKGWQAMASDKKKSVYERNAVKFTIQPIAPDHKGPISLDHIKHAMRKFSIRQTEMARAMRKRTSWTASMLSGVINTDQDERRAIAAAIWRLSEVPK